MPGQCPDRMPGAGMTNEPPLGRRIFRPRNVLSFLVALVVLYLVLWRGFDLEWGEVWAHMRRANAGLLVLAFAVFYSSFFFRALRWQALLVNVGYGRDDGQPVPSTFGLARIMYLAWFANCIAVARLGDAYRGYLLKRSAGISFTVALGTVLAERLLDLSVLAAILSATVLIAFRGTLPQEAAGVLIVGLVLSAVGVVGLLLMRRLQRLIEWILPRRLHTHYARFERSTVDSFRRVPLLVGYSVIGWVIEGLTLYLIVVAVGVQVSVAGALVVALITSLLTTVPFTPAGLGFAEAGAVLVLRWLGLDVDTAVAVALLLRVINYWSIIAFGSVLYFFGAGKPVKARMDLSLEQEKKR